MEERIQKIISGSGLTSRRKAEELIEQGKTWKPSVIMDNAQDEYAIASMMYDMRAYIEEDKEVYPMAEALEDAYLYLLMKEAAGKPGCKVVAEKMPWHEVE